MEDTYSDRAERFSLDGYHTRAKVTNVHDGDTIRAVFKMPHSDTPYKWTCRLSGIDTPELRSHDMHEVQLAEAARTELTETVLNKVVDIACGKFDKYGRMLVTISIEGVCINDMLKNKGHARAYDGREKMPW